MTTVKNLLNKSHHLGQGINSDLNQTLHFSTLQLSEVKKENVCSSSSFLDDPKSPPHLLSGILSTQQSRKKGDRVGSSYLLSRSKRKKSPILDGTEGEWASSH